MKLTYDESYYLQKCLIDVLKDELVQSMKKYIQHGNTTTYNHCERVAFYSYLVAKRLNLKVDLEVLILGAFLHDFDLYDCHESSPSHQLHGFCHP